MSGALIAECARFLYSSTTTKTVNVPVTDAITAGDLVVLSIDCPAGGGANTQYTVTDGHGNTYTTQQIGPGGANGQPALACFLALSSMATSEHWTVTADNFGAVIWAVHGAHFSGMDSYDTGAANNATGTGMDTTNPGPTGSQSQQLVVAAFGFTGTGVVISGLTGGFTSFTVLTTTGTIRNLLVAYAFVNSGSARRVQATMDASHGWAAAMIAANVDIPPAITFTKTVTVG